jgi:hypothetical protein
VPAGKYGYAVVRDGHFEFEKLPGVPQRFYGINVCYGDCYPDSPEKADGMVSYFAACGYNAIRIHHYDFKVTVGKGGVVPDESLLRRMDSLVDACVRHGLYITTDLFCSRGHSVAWRDVGIDADGTVDWSYKAMAILHAGTTENLKQFTRNFLCHRNVYTGRRLADEPALSWISLINEGMLAHHPTPKAGTTAYAVMSGIWKAGWRRSTPKGRLPTLRATCRRRRAPGTTRRSAVPCAPSTPRRRLHSRRRCANSSVRKSAARRC